MRDVYNRKFDAIAIQSGVYSAGFVRFNQGRLHEFIVQKRSWLAQESSFMLCACFVHNLSVCAQSPFIHFHPQFFHIRESAQRLVWRGFSWNTRGCQLFLRQRDERVTLMHDVNR
jgi:hypothetical protein